MVVHINLLIRTCFVGSAFISALYLGTVSAAPNTSIHGGVPRTSRDEIVRQFEPREFVCTDRKYREKKFLYRLYVPTELNQAQKYPLLLWFHGHGEAGDDNLKNLTHLDAAMIRYARVNGSFPGFILVPQVPKGEDWFDPEMQTQEDMLTVSWAMVVRTIQEYPIDEDRILLAGVCSGGDACWEMGMRHPQQFAAIVPIVTRGGDESRAASLGTTPVWSFHNRYDTTTPIDGNRQMVAAVRAAGGYALLTELADVAHGAWAHAFGDYHILDWLLEQRRGHVSWNIYLQFADWSKLVIGCGLMLLIVAVGWAAFCRRKARRRTLPFICSAVRTRPISHYSCFQEGSDA